MPESNSRAQRLDDDDGGDDEEARVGAIPSSQMPKLRGIKKNREYALESLQRRTLFLDNNTTTDVVTLLPPQEQNKQQMTPPPTIRTRNIPASSKHHRQSQTPSSSYSETEKKKDKFDIMDVVRARAIMANEEIRNQEALLMQPPPPHHHPTHITGRLYEDPLSCEHSHSTTSSTPGAFAAAPGEVLHRRENIHFSLLRIRRRDDIRFSFARIHSRGVEDMTTYHGNSLDPNSIPPHHNSKRNNRKCDGLHLLSIVLAIIGVIVVLLVAIPIASSPTAVVSTSDSPSSAPSGPMDLLLESLPEQTQERICCNSPQYKAWEWLWNHPNITNLEEWRKKQLFALATFYYSFEGENWNKFIREGWMDYEKDECEWFSSGYGYFDIGEYYEFEYQIPSCNDGGEFTSLYLQDLQLSTFSPSMPPEIALLTSLSTIWISEDGINASLSDMLPSAVVELKSLTSVSFARNDITGQFPSEFGLMTSLTSLYLNDNALTGQIPSALGLMTSMTYLWLSSNQLTGAILSNMGSMTSLEWVQLRNNSLSGNLPSELGLMTSMSSLDLSTNNFNGSIPAELRMMTKMESLYAENNSLTGQLPTELGLITSMTYLWLFSNRWHNSV